MKIRVKQYEFREYILYDIATQIRLSAIHLIKTPSLKFLNPKLHEINVLWRWHLTLVLRGRFLPLSIGWGLNVSTVFCCNAALRTTRGSLYVCLSVCLYVSFSFFAIYSKNLQATHTPKFVIICNIFLRMPL